MRNLIWTFMNTYLPTCIVSIISELSRAIYPEAAALHHFQPRPRTISSRSPNGALTCVSRRRIKCYACWALKSHCSPVFVYVDAEALLPVLRHNVRPQQYLLCHFSKGFCQTLTFYKNRATISDSQFLFSSYNSYAYLPKTIYACIWELLWLRV